MQSAQPEPSLPGRFSWPGVSSLGRALPFVGTVALLLIFRLALVTGYACLNETFLTILGAADRSAEEGEQQFAGCLSPNSPLLEDARGRLRLVQVTLYLSGPQAASAMLSSQNAASSLNRLEYLLVGNTFLAVSDVEAVIVNLSQAEAIEQLISAGYAAQKAGDEPLAFKYWEAAHTLWREKGFHTREERELAAVALENLAAAWRREGNYRLAADAFAEKAEILQPPSLDTLTNAGNLYYRAGDLNAAEKWYESARLNFPTKGKPYFGLGQVMIAREDWEQAVYYFSSAVQYGPDNSETWLMLGYAFLQTGQENKACETFFQSLQLFPAHKLLQQQFDAANCELELR